VDRGRPGSKQHLLVDATGIPLAFSVTGGNRNDVTQLIPLLDAVPATTTTSTGDSSVNAASNP
jgi:transposase